MYAKIVTFLAENHKGFSTSLQKRLTLFSAKAAHLILYFFRKLDEPLNNDLIKLLMLKKLRPKVFTCAVELQWLKHLWDYENLFETGVVRAIEGLL